MLKCPAWGQVSLILVSTNWVQLRLRWLGAEGGHQFQKFRCRQLKLASQKQIFIKPLLKIQNSSCGEIKWWVCGTIKWWACGTWSHAHWIQPEFHNDMNLFFKAGCSSGLGQHQFALSGDVVLDHYPLPLSTLTQIFPGSARGLTTLGFLRARADWTFLVALNCMGI